MYVWSPTCSTTTFAVSIKQLLKQIVRYCEKLNTINQAGENWRLWLALLRNNTIASRGKNVYCLLFTTSTFAKFNIAPIPKSIVVLPEPIPWYCPFKNAATLPHTQPYNVVMTNAYGPRCVSFQSNRRVVYELVGIAKRRFLDHQTNPTINKRPPWTPSDRGMIILQREGLV